MAEFVEYRMERTLPEYEQMRILNLFTHEEILKMKKARENFEYRCTQPSRDIKDFVEYIKYERSVIGLTKQRSKLYKLTQNHTIATLIAGRMKQLYAQALSKFPHNLRFWDEYIKFLQQFKFTKDIPATFDHMLQFHSDKADVWIRAILWEYNENYSHERVKGLLLRAQHLHPESQKLYLTFFQIELENKREADESLALQHAQIVYTNGKKTFTNVTFYIEMLNIVDKFSYANSIQHMIMNDLREMFQHEEIMWHTLAQRELNDLSTDQFIKLENEDNAMDEDSSRLTAVQHSQRKRIEKCVEIYQEAVQVVNTAKMWTYYINAMLALNNDTSSAVTQIGLKRFSLSQAFEGANNSNQMSETHYLQYIELLYSNNPKDENIEQVLQKATKMFGTSESIWLQYLRYYIQANNFKKLKEIFKTAKLRLGATNGSEVWELYLIYLKSVQSNEANSEFERLISEVACQPHRSFNVLKAHILELLATTVSMKRARKTYLLFIKHFPSCYEVHEMMAELEAKQLKRDLDSERHCLEMLILNFGKTRTDVWLRYMRFERNVGEPKNVGRLHKSALATLKPELLDEFSAMYNFFSNGDV
ncbi:U3 small nucleolar RNA-associated protein 6 homolog [Sitodiplosis mosellana]|uniref:U3 small nucleolar RNA-associated protein 6 homolog n=1 Tax=Sitodiplosis mosellana TaxID=263140 RepID=UPI002444D848|nr:U3 small nucleolar RNA-associated protein 6 homolog [Sitodiplosis mosellana]